MIKQLTGLLHLIISLLFCFYIFIIPTNFNYDFFYILLNTIQIILFILCDNKCPITYLYQLYTNKIVNNNEDFNEIIPDYLFIKYIFLIIVIFGFISVYYASTRSKILSSIVSLLFLFTRIIYLSYNNLIVFETRTLGHTIFGKLFSKIEKIYDDLGVHKMTEPYFNNGILIIQFLFLIYIFVHNKKRLHI
jgi:hypothetical protein